MLLLIDGHSLAYRAFYALPQTMQTREGQVTNVLHGFVKMLLRIVSDLNPKFLAIAFDTKAPSFRHELFDGYKAHRPPSPPAFHPQLPLLQELLRGAGVTVVTQDGVEADDLLATMAALGERHGVLVNIVTGDKDLLQCVTPMIRVLLPQSGLSVLKPYTTDNFQTETGLTPDQIVEYKSLKGDTSDNIPGVPGIGDKTAMTLLQRYHTVENLLNHQAELPAKVREKLNTHADSLLMSRTLATLIHDVPMDVTMDALRFDGLHLDRVRPLLDRLELHKLLALADRKDVLPPILPVVPPEPAPQAEQQAFVFPGM